MRACAVARLDDPAAARRIEDGGGDVRVELDVAPQIETVRHMIGVAQQLRLCRVTLAPLPFLLQRVGELVRILHALDVAARARIAVPVPGPADAAPSLEHAG